MIYRSTRGGQEINGAAEAIIKGIADDKGLFVPSEIPTLSGDIENMSYRNIAKRVIGAFFDDYTDEEISDMVESAYDSKFPPKVVPIVKAGGAWFLELYHGKTSAFKDVALSILPYLLTTAVKKTGEDKKICILTATSGDTGKAALEGFSDVQGTEIIVFYPENGVSAVQKAQMVTQTGSNTHVVAIRGNFDDAQRGVKAIFNDGVFGEKLAEKGVKLSSANSINVGRLVPQVAYYVYAYGRLVAKGVIKSGEKINIVVPTGNFGNILAAYYAGKMGIPINKFICASNENRILTDFINTGVYDTRREFYLTNSPSMDILVSSNLERLLYHLAKEENQNVDEKNSSNAPSAKIKDLMAQLESEGIYEVTPEIKSRLNMFYGGFATVSETNTAIGSMYRDNKYLMDTHTAVAYKVYQDYRDKTGDDTLAIIASTASPYKFATSVAESIGLANATDDFGYLDLIESRTGIDIPEGLKNLDKKEVRHKEVIEISKMKDAIMDALK